jgi:light-harvesting complex I chlorophyll a/b binding protein 1
VDSSYLAIHTKLACAQELSSHACKAKVVRQAAAAPVADFSSELGATPPLGFWDPLGLSKANDPQVAAFQFKRRRIIEIQHGRVAMLATTGYIVPEYFRWPGCISPSMNVAFADIPNGLKGAAYIPGAGWLQMIAFVGLVEVTNLQCEPTDTVGDYGYGAFGLPFGKKIEDKEKKMKSLNAELNNGRLAMMAIIGMFYQDPFFSTQLCFSLWHPAYILQPYINMST